MGEYVDKAGLKICVQGLKTYIDNKADEISSSSTSDIPCVIRVDATASYTDLSANGNCTVSCSKGIIIISANTSGTQPSVVEMISIHDCGNNDYTTHTLSYVTIRRVNTAAWYIVNRMSTAYRVIVYSTTSDII